MLTLLCRAFYACVWLRGVERVFFFGREYSNRQSCVGRWVGVVVG